MRKNSSLFVLCVLLIFCFCGCKTSQVELIKKEKIVIPITDDIEYQTNFLQYISDTDSNELLTFYNEKKLIYFDLIKKEKKFEVSLLNKVDALFVLSLDSIFIVPSRTNDLILCDSKGVVLNKWNIKDSINDSIYFENYQVKVFIDKSSDLNVFFELNHDLTFPEYYQYPKVLFLKITKYGKIVEKKKFAKYPENFINNEFLNFDCKFEIAKNKLFVIHYLKENYIYLYNSDLTLNEKIKFNSKNINEFIAITDEEKKDKSFYRIQQYERPFYWELFYDKYRDLYYLQAIHSQKYKNEDGTLNGYFDRSWSILVFNQDFELLDEIYMEPKKYLFKNMVVTKDGLLISNNVESNPEFDPNLLQFTFFEVKIKWEDYL